MLEFSRGASSQAFALGITRTLHATVCMEVTYMCHLLGLSLLLALADFAYM